MNSSTVRELITVWSKFSGEVIEGANNLEIELFKKLVAFFQAGDFYCYIFNFTFLDVELVTDSVSKVLGINQKDFNLKNVMGMIHPEDQAYFVNFENEVAKFLLGLPPEKRMKYKMRSDYRIKRKDGAYIRILHQVVVLELYENGNLFRTFGIHTDITHLKPTGKPMLSIIGMDGEPSYINVIPGELLVEVDEPLSKREKEILLLMIDGKKTTEIAELLFISIRTVETHRKNMLCKTETQTTGQLIAQAIKNGWI